MSRKTQIGWISVGVLLCLFSVALTVKMRDGNKAVAREDDGKAVTPPPPLPPITDATPLPLPPPPEARLHTPEAPSPIIRTGATNTEVLPDVSGPKSSPPVPAPPVPAPSDPAPSLPTPLDTGKPLPPIVFPDDAKAQTPPLPPPGTVEVKPPLLPPVPPLTQLPPEVKKEVIPEAKKEIIPVSASAKQDPGEPPMVVPAGPVQIYQVRGKTETLPDISRRTLGSSERWNEIARLNPDLKPDSVLPSGTTVRLPSDACIQEDPDAVKPLPSLRPKETEKAKVMPLTGTYPCTIDEHKILTLPKAIRDQLGNCDTVLVSPGPDHCLWITNHAHLERLAERIEHSSAREGDVRVFKRLYYAQTEKASVTAEGRIAVSDKLAQFAGLGQELVIVGIDEHFELWDAAKWKQYTQQKSAAARAAADE